ncbi:hypothetical protein KKJ15_18000, partial [Xenorhabdus bovienii]|nr:hypothetical protein [Xenorhabdus bovienii]MDE9523442.1 hypothetical protein [Xenorhabdus bovienii]
YLSILGSSATQGLHQHPMPSVNAGGIFVSEFRALTAHINKTQPYRKSNLRNPLMGISAGGFLREQVRFSIRKIPDE